jgi:nucleoside phosphorylase
VVVLAATATLVPAVSASPRAAACGSTSVLLLSAYPAEIQANLGREVLDPNQPQTVDGHKFFAGTLLGRRVILGLTGEGTKNGHDTTLLALEHFSCVSAVVFTGTAGGGAPAGIGDVTVPSRWTGDAGTSYELVNPVLLSGARKIAAEAAAQLETSASVNVGPCGAATPPVVYLPRAPQVLTGGTGSTDNGGNPGTCTDSGGALGGCHPCPPGGSSPAALPSGPVAVPRTGGQTEAERSAARPHTDVATDAVVAHEQETASSMAAATSLQVPFIAFRAISDDNLPANTWLLEYLAYQQLAADNAAVAARLWIRDWNGLPETARPPAKAPVARRPAGHRPAKAPAVTSPAGSLAATGLGSGVPLAGAVLVAAGLALGLRKRRPQR